VGVFGGAELACITLLSKHKKKKKKEKKEERKQLKVMALKE